MAINPVPFASPLAFRPFRGPRPLGHDLLTNQERFVTALLFPSFFSHYFAEGVAKEIESSTSKWARLYLAPMGCVLNACLLPFALIAGAISLVAMIVFMGIRDRINEDFTQESWNRAIRIALFTTFISPIVALTSPFISLGDPTFSLIERAFGGFPEELKI